MLRIHRIIDTSDPPFAEHTFGAKVTLIIENIRLKELAIIAQLNRPFFDDLLSYLSDHGYPTLYSFVNEQNTAEAQALIHNYLVSPAAPNIKLFDGVGQPYQVAKAKWLLLGWVFRDAPEQRLKPLISTASGNTPTSRQATILNQVREHVAKVFPDPASWTWTSIVEVVIDRLEGSRRAKKGNLFEIIVRRSLEAVFSANGLDLTVANSQIKLGGETYDIVVEGQKTRLLMPVKTRETMGGGHAHIFTRDIHKSIAVAVDAGFPCLPVIIAESWSGNLGDLACEDHVYVAMNPNQVDKIEPVLQQMFTDRLKIFEGI